MSREAVAAWVAKAIEAGKIPADWEDMFVREVIERHAHAHGLTEEQARADLTGEACPAPGTLWLNPATGDAYRLRDYRTDWTAEPFTGDTTRPAYTLLLASGGATTIYDELPEGVVLIWSPDQDDARALLASRVSTLPSEAQLIEWVHHRNRFDYDECQHGTYTGGPSHGEPYAMCERQGKALHALLTTPSSLPTITDDEREVIDAATEYVQNSGLFLASDGRMSYAVGDDSRLRAAVAALHPGGETNGN